MAGVFLLKTKPKSPPSDMKTKEKSATPFSYGDYAELLSTYVDNRGRVPYYLIKNRPEKLAAFVRQLDWVDPKVYETWNEKEKIAFWINAYNAATLKAIIDHYPISTSLFGSVLFPKNSIRQIAGVWDKLQFPVMGKPVTLNEIEHEILRAKFSEPRIHVALVCASMGCPPLRNEPFTGDRLDEQLNDQAHRFLADPQKFQIDRSQGQVLLSPIFDWYGEDFVKSYGTEERFLDHSRTERAVLNFVSRSLDEAGREYLTKAKYQIQYLGYDWSLNEQPPVERIS